MSEVLVTGAAGFIGTHLLARLRDDGHRVHGIDIADGDIAAAETWANLPKADAVVHLAARSFVPDSWREPTAFLRDNVLGTAHALDYARAHGARVLFLSSYMYGATTVLPIPETAPVVAQNPYALSKHLGEELCRFHAERFGIPVTVLRPFNVYGAGQSDRFLVPWIIQQIRAGGPIRVKDLEPRRDYVYVEDLVAAMVAAIAPSTGFRVSNVGSGVSHSVAELIATIQAAMGTAFPVESADERRQDEIMDTVADISAAGRALGWAPRFALREGIDHLLTRA